MPVRFAITPDQLNAFQADQWAQPHMEALADDWQQQQLAKANADYAPPPVAPTPSDSLTNPLGTGNAGPMTDVPSALLPSASPSPTPDVSAPALPAPDAPPTMDFGGASPAPAPSMPSPSAPPTMDFGPVPSASPTRPLAVPTAPPPISSSPTPSFAPTTAGLSGGGAAAAPTLTGRGQALLSTGAGIASWLGDQGQKALQAVLVTEGGLNNARGDSGASAGPLQFYEGGQLANFARERGLTLDQAKTYVEQHPEEAIAWAVGTPDKPGYLGRSILNGLSQGLTGADLATWAQRTGQVSVSPERAGKNYDALFGGGTGPFTVTQGNTVASQPIDTSLSLSQFGDKTLTADEAYAACGPAAAARLAAEFGNAIPLSAALSAAKQTGWTSSGGMNGIANEKKLFDALGLPAELDTSGDWNKIIQGASNGQLVTISTPGHYFQANAVRQRADGQTELYVGQSGLDLKGGKAWMTPAEMEQRMGTLNGALFSDPGRAVLAGDWYQAQAQNHGFDPTPAAPIVAEIGQAAQKAGITQQPVTGPDETVSNPFGEAFRQIGAVKDQLTSQIQSPNSGNPVVDTLGTGASALGTGVHAASDALRNITPTSELARGATGMEQIVTENRALFDQQQRLVDEFAGAQQRGDQAAMDRISTEMDALQAQLPDVRNRDVLHAAADRNPSTGLIETGANLAGAAIAAPLAAEGLPVAAQALAAAVDPATGVPALAGRAFESATPLLRARQRGEGINPFSPPPIDRAQLSQTARRALDLNSGDAQAALAQVERAASAVPGDSELEQALTELRALPTAESVAAVSPSTASPRLSLEEQLSTHQALGQQWEELDNQAANLEAQAAQAFNPGLRARLNNEAGRIRAQQDDIMQRADYLLEHGTTPSEQVADLPMDKPAAVSTATAVQATQPAEEANTVRQLSTWLVRKDGPPGISVEPMGNGVGGTLPDAGHNIVFRDQHGVPQGVLAITDVADVAVNPEFQRQGIATQLYQAAKNAGIDVESLTGKGGYTPQGAAFAQSRIDRGLTTSLAQGASRSAVTSSAILSSPNYRRLVAMRGTPEQQAALRPAEDGFAGNINLEKITPAAVKDALTRTMDSPSTAEFAGQRRGVITDSQAMENAATKALSMSPQDWIKTRAGRAFNQEEAIALGNQLVKTGNEYDTMRTALAKADQDGTATDLMRAAVADKSLEFALLEGVRSGAAAEAGRALRSFRQVLDGSLATKDGDTSKALRAAFKTLGGEDAYAEWAQRWAQLDPADTIGKYKMLQALHQPSKMNKLMAWTTSNMLSGTKTLEVNLVGGAIETINRPAIELLGGRPRDAITDIAAMGRAIGEAWGNAGTTLATGIRPSRAAATLADPTKYDAVRAEAFPGKSGLVATPALRVMSATDEFMRTLNAAGGLAVAARREARATGQTVQSVLADPPTHVLKFAQDAADAAVFEGKGTPVSEAVIKWRNLINSGNPAERAVGVGANVLFPFVHIPEQILIRGTRMLPVANEASTIMAIRRGMQSKNPQQVRDAVGRYVLTDALLLAAGSQVLAGNITGNGPTEPAKRAALEAARDSNGNKAWQAHSIRMGDRWIDYTNLGPVTIPLAALSNAHEAYLDSGKKVEPNIAADVFNRVAATMLDATYIKSFGDLMKGISEGNLTKAAGSLVGNTATRFVPFSGLAAQAERSMDQDTKNPRNLSEYIASRVPVASETVPDKPSPFGGTVQQPQDLLADVSPFKTSAPGVPDLVAKAFTDVGMGAPAAPNTISVRSAVTGNTSPPMKLTEDEKTRYVQIMGDRLKQRLTPLVSAPSWQTRSPEARQKALDAQLKAVRDYAEAQIYRGMSQDDRQRRMAEGRKAKEPLPLVR